MIWLGLLVFLFVTFLVDHLAARSLGQTRRQRRQLERQWEHNRLFWHIRELEEEIYGRWLS